MLCMPMAVFAGGKTDAAAMNTEVAATGEKSAKYVFLFIGDGMAMPQISAAEVYSKALSSKRLFAVPRFRTHHHLRRGLVHHRLRLGGNGDRERQQDAERRREHGRVQDGAVQDDS